MTLAILATFAIVVGKLTTDRLRSDFDSQVTQQAQNLASEIQPIYQAGILRVPDLTQYTALSNGYARVLSTDLRQSKQSAGTPNLGHSLVPLQVVDGLTVATLRQNFGGGYAVYVQYALPVATLNNEIARLDLLLVVGVLGGAMLAFMAGALVARRAMTPIAELTSAAREITRTGDPSGSLPEPSAEDDEVAELSRTLGEMLASLSGARAATEHALARQRQFVADASHELRTPLTSVLANLELLVESLRGEERDAARSALRSTQRMRRLVADLLLLARADVGRSGEPEPTDLAELVLAAAAELEPSCREHELELRVAPAPTLGLGDDLQRVAINLIENAIRHTPPGTHIVASTRRLPDGAVELSVADEGPGIDPSVRDHLFERFARGSGDRGASFGLGLAIVAAVTEAHAGTISVESEPGTGARFTVILPAQARDPAPAVELAPLVPA